MGSQRYTNVEPLGRGGMGDVFQAHDTLRGVPVALKVVSQGSDARFLREIEALSRLDHPGIVAVREVFANEQGVPVMVLDLLPGSLRDRLRARGPFDEAEVIEVGVALADALACAHQAGILHRDLKPANVLVDDAGQPVLTDFGLAHLADERERLTRTGEVLGTPAFLSPEQADGDLSLVGPATDVYGLGATLYALATGQPPFVGKSTLDTLRAVLMDPPPTPSRVRAGLSAGLDAVILRCLAKEPEARYASAGEVADALQALAADPGAPPADASGRLVLGLGVAVCGLGAALLFLATRAPDPTPAPTTTPAAPSPVAALPRPTAQVEPVDEATLAELRRELRRDPAAVEARIAELQRTRSEPAGRLLALLGEARLRQTNLEGALQAWAAALEREESFALRLERGSLLLELGRRTDALADARAARRLRPEHLGARLLEVQAGNGVLPGKEIHALYAELGPRALAARPQTAEGWCWRGRVLAFGRQTAAERARRYPEAERSFTRAIQLDPRSSVAYAERANIRYRMEAQARGRGLRAAPAFGPEPYARPQADARQALQLDPYNPSAVYNLACAVQHSREGIAESASLFLRRAKLRPWYTPGWVDAGDRLMMVGRQPDAELAFSRALQQDPKHYRASLQRGVIRLELGKRAAALTDLRRALALAPDARARAEAQRLLDSAQRRR